MVITHNQTNKKPSGGTLNTPQPKRLAQRGNPPIHTRIGEKKVKLREGLGGNTKRALVATEEANVQDREEGESFTAEVENVVENPASRHFVRRNIITKGAVIETSEGKARVTNRPGQEGVVNAVLLKE